VYAIVRSNDSLNSFALYHDVGCGKTLTATAIMGELFNKRLVRRVLVIAPVSVVPVWPAEVAKWGAFDSVVVAAQGTAAKRVDTIKRMPKADKRLQVVVINYEAIGRSAPIQEALLKSFKPDMVILDEAHRVKNHTAKQSKAIYKLGKQAKYRLAMTGTPVANLALDLFGIYQFLDPSIFGSSYTAFKARYAYTVPLPGGGTMVTGMRADMLAELSEKAHSIAHTVTKEEALDLPDFVDVDIPVKLEPKARKFYDELKKESIAYLSEQTAAVATNVLTRIMRLQQVTGGFVKDDSDAYHQVSFAKIDALKDILQDTPSKIVVFARFTNEIHAITRLAESLRMNPVVIDGSVSMKDRGEIVEQFQDDEDTRVFVAQIQSAGLGITLTSADTAVFFSTGWSLAEYQQARGRIHRIGQKNKVTYLHLVADDTVDCIVTSSLRSKQDIADLVQNKWKSLLA